MCVCVRACVRACVCLCMYVSMCCLQQPSVSWDIEGQPHNAILLSQHVSPWRKHIFWLAHTTGDKQQPHEGPPETASSHSVSVCMWRCVAHDSKVGMVKGWHTHLSYWSVRLLGKRDRRQDQRGGIGLWCVCVCVCEFSWHRCCSIPQKG